MTAACGRSHAAGWSSHAPNTIGNFSFDVTLSYRRLERPRRAPGLARRNVTARAGGQPPGGAGRGAGGGAGAGGGGGAGGRGGGGGGGRAGGWGRARRRARRYADQAAASGRVAVPEPAAVFTVKLPVRLAAAVREHATASGRTISAVVAQALEEFLERGRRKHPRR